MWTDTGTVKDRVAVLRTNNFLAFLFRLVEWNGTVPYLLDRGSVSKHVCVRGLPAMLLVYPQIRAFSVRENHCQMPYFKRKHTYIVVKNIRQHFSPFPRYASIYPSLIIFAFILPFKFQFSPSSFLFRPRSFPFSFLFFLIPVFIFFPHMTTALISPPPRWWRIMQYMHAWTSKIN